MRHGGSRDVKRAGFVALGTDFSITAWRSRKPNSMGTPRERKSTE
jgi:hypothetical protein